MANLTLTTPDDIFVPADMSVRCVRKYYINSTKTYYIYEGYSGIPENLTLSVIVWMILFTVFVVVRRTVYSKFRLPEDCPDLNVCKDCVRAYLGWIPHLFKLKPQQFSQRCGPDALLYLQFQKYLIAYMMVVCLISLSIILPVNYHGNLIDDPKNFARTTIANIQPNAHVLWVHSLTALFYLFMAFCFMKSIKSRYLATRHEDMKTKTLILTNLPPCAQAEQMLIEYFRRFMGCVKEAERYQDTMLEKLHFAYDVGGLQKAYDEKQRIHELRQHAEKYADEVGEREIMWTGACGCCCLCCYDNGWACCGPVRLTPILFKIDCLEYYKDEEQRLTDVYNRLLGQSLGRPLDIAFVTFSTEQMARRVLANLSRLSHCRQQCFQMVCHPGSGRLDVRRCDVYYASEPQDMYWQNLSGSRLIWWLRALLVNALLCLLLFVFTTPSVIMNLLDEWRYKKALEALHSPTLVNVVPVLLLLLFSTLLPATVYLTEGLIAHWSRSKEQKIIMIKCFVFLLLMILILPSLGLTSVRALVQWLADKDQGSSTRWSCIFLPDNGAFFVNYIIAAAFIGTSVQLLGIWRLICLGVRLGLARSTMERHRAWKLATDEEFSYGVQYAWYLVLFCTMVSYSVCIPLITPFGLVYLILKHMVDRHNIYYTTRPTRMSPEPHFRAVNFVHTAVVMLQFNIIAFSMLRAHGMPPPPAIFSLVVLVATLLYLTAKTIYNYIKAGVRYIVEIPEDGEPASAAAQHTYIPEVILNGASKEDIERSIA